MKKKYFVFFICFALGLTTILSQVELPAIISSNMVLQRDTEVALWGWAGKQERLEIKASWLSQPIHLQADNQGKWSIKVKTTLTKEPQTLRFLGENSEILIKNVLFGEVWLCSGQSNMQHPVKGLPGQPTFGSQKAILQSQNSNLRLFSVGRIGSKIPLSDLKEYEPWREASPKNVSEFSAVGYFFANQLQKQLDVPVGIIHSSWGGSYVEPWMSREVLNKFQEINHDKAGNEVKWNHSQTVLFNAMINPLIPYTLKGFLWYQGESNRLKPEEYKILFPEMVRDWRNRWSLGDIPFYFVQIAPFIYNGNDSFQDVQNSAFIREAQLHCVDSIPNSGISITMDIGDKISIHPPKKKEVADRLLAQALAKTYGVEGLNPESPVYKTFEIEEGRILLKFDNAPEGVYTYDSLKGFEIAGEDHVFYPAEAKIENRRDVIVWNENVKKPLAVRYGWNNWVEATLFGTNLLPVSSFRTDNWEKASRPKIKTINKPKK